MSDDKMVCGVRSHAASPAIISGAAAILAGSKNRVMQVKHGKLPGQEQQPTSGRQVEAPSEGGSLRSASEDGKQLRTFAPNTLRASCPMYTSSSVSCK